MAACRVPADSAHGGEPRSCGSGRRPQRVDRRRRDRPRGVAVYYLAVPPSLFGTVADGIAAVGLAPHARLVVENTLLDVVAVMRPPPRELFTGRGGPLPTDHVRLRMQPGPHGWVELPPPVTDGAGQ